MVAFIIQITRTCSLGTTPDRRIAEHITDLGYDEKTSASTYDIGGLWTLGLVTRRIEI